MEYLKSFKDILYISNLTQKNMVNENIVNEENKKKRKTNSSEYNAKYYKENKHRILQNFSQIAVCPNCGKNSTIHHLKRHMSSNLCKKRSGMK
jgi:hypothetical protein